MLLSACWTTTVVRWDGLARDPGMWGSICLGVAAMLATLLVFVVTLAPMLVQMHFRHTAGLAATVLDGAAVAYGAFFISGTLLPVLAAAAPSRAATVAVIAGAMPVLGSLVPAVLFFVARLRSGWLLQRRVACAEAFLASAPPLRRLSVRREREALIRCRGASWAIRLVMKHAGDSWDDQYAARQSAVRLLRAAAAADTLTTRRFVIEEVRSFAWLGSEQRSPSVRRDVVYVLAAAAESARPATGRHIIYAVLDALRALGEATDVTPTERQEIAQATQAMVASCVTALEPSVPPHDISRRVPRTREGEPGVRHLAGISMQSDEISARHVWERGVAVIRDLVGPPNRPLDDSRAAQLQANAFAAGCRVLAELAEELQKKHLWVDYDVIVDCLGGWLNHRLGTGSSRIDDLVDKGPQPFPYGLELEAAAEALSDITISAYSTGFDHTARSALASLLRHAERALHQDAVAFALATRALARAHSQLFGTSGTEIRDLAEHARAVDLMTSLQEENRRLLTAALNAAPADEAPRTDAHQDDAAWARAMRELRIWALRPIFRSSAGYGQLALATARTAQAVRQPAEPIPVRRLRGGHEMSDSDLMKLWREARAFDHGRAYDLDSDLRIGLIQALWPSEGTEPGLEVFRAGVRWRAALEAAEMGVEDDDRAREMLADLAGHGTIGGRRVSPEAKAFGQRIAAWAEAPWCRTRIVSPTSCIPDADDLVFVPVTSDDTATDLGALVRHYRAERQQQLADSEFSKLSDSELRAAGLLWGAWPPPFGCPCDPWDEPSWSSSGAITYKLDEYHAGRTRGWPHPGREVTDRIYQARTSGKERIVVTEPDGSNRLLCGVDTGHEPFSLVHGGSGEAVLARRLTADALGPLALCPACHGGSATDWMPGWCRTCRGLRKHPDLGRAEHAVATAVVRAADGKIEWDISRSDLLDAVATLNSRTEAANHEPNRTEPV
ncbi:hypothetical protein [Streptomyces phaeochromogenes]|uniref:hypothetical protein n=1 Tax=Streptomyces phaeochromogenes TaxID=1923 RepID=UPI00386637DC|nr:hypothetical protein OG277_15825 [Streptomyces phaeochromogenes]